MPKAIVIKYTNEHVRSSEFCKSLHFRKQTNKQQRKKTPPNEPPYGLLLIFSHSLKL